MRKTILIADDDNCLAELLARRCESIGFDTIVVDNAQCAQFAMISEQPDLAILDLNMPAANDGDVFELLSTDPQLTDMPIIILTGQKDRATIQLCESLQTHYVPKQGAVWSRLKSTIKELLADTQNCASLVQSPRSPLHSRIPTVV